MVRVLLRFLHGLGDAVQLGVVLKHLARHRPDWEVHVRAGRGKHTALHGLCHRVYHDQEDEPAGPFQTDATLGWYENYSGYPDRPNTKITNCLAEVFGLGWDADLGSYEIRPSAAAMKAAADYLRLTGARAVGPGKFASVVIHYQGNTSTWKKDLQHWQAKSVIDLVHKAGHVPVVLDWDGRSPLPDQKTVFCPEVHEGDIWGGFGSGDAGVIAALVAQSQAFVGIDSGPGKCASATATPALIVWREHHPMQFHDPAANTTHLIPSSWRGLAPCEKPGVAEFFEKHYRYTTYAGEHGLVQAARAWLAGVLGVEDAGENNVPYLLPNGIGDVTWALLKIRAVAGDGPVDVVLSGDPAREVDRRAVPFVRRFGFVRSCEVLDVPVLDVPSLNGYDDRRNDARGRYRYKPDGEQGGFHLLVPNKVLEDGRRLEEWLPEHPLDWAVLDEFDWTGTGRGDELGQLLEPFAALYLGPESGNVDEGHNRGFLWEPRHWCRLARGLADRGLRLALVGADYDRSYWERYCKQGFAEQNLEPVDLIGKLEIGETFALLRKAKVFISYQCGLGVFAHYLGVPLAMWWRPEGDSCHPRRLVSFDEKMAAAWTRPGYEDRYLPLIYKKQTPGDILAEVDRRGWLEEGGPCSTA